MKRGRFGENITNDHKITTLHNGRASEDQDASGKAGSTFSSGKSSPENRGYWKRRRPRRSLTS
jgi:hypothetical protein